MAKEKGQKNKQWCTKHYAEKERSSNMNGTGGIMVSVLASSVVDHGFEPWSGQNKDYQICICWFSDKHAVLRRKSQDWLVGNQENLFEWGEMSIHRLLFQWGSTIKIQLSLCLLLGYYFCLLNLDDIHFWRMLDTSKMLLHCKTFTSLSFKLYNSCCRLIFLLLMNNITGVAIWDRKTGKPMLIIIHTCITQRSTSSKADTNISMRCFQ
jgi:hypothetical protein